MTELPELRIVDQVLWDKVQARRKARPVMKKGTPVLNGKYLLSGLLLCGECGSRFVMADSYRYGCAGHLNRGACKNDLRVARTIVEGRCLAGIRTQLLTPERFTLFVTETSRLLAERKRHQRPDSGRLKEDVAALDEGIANLVDTQKKGLGTMSTKRELERMEAERERKSGQIEQLESGGFEVAALLPRAKERYEALVTQLGQVPPVTGSPCASSSRAWWGRSPCTRPPGATWKPRCRGAMRG